LRLYLAKAMINEPNIFLLDETNAGLDLEISRSTRELLRYLRNERGPV